MPNLGEALDAAMGARYGWPAPKSPVTTRRGLVAQMNALIRHYGSSHAAAAAARVPVSTWNHWKAGHRLPSLANRRKIERAYATDIMRPAMLRRLLRKGLPKLIRVTAVIRWSDSPKKQYNRRAHRTTTLDQLTVGDVQQVVDAWMHLGGEAAGQSLEYVTAARYKVLRTTSERRARDGDFVGVAFEGNEVTVELIGRW